MANLPTGIPRLDAIVRVEAERLAEERYSVWAPMVRTTTGALIPMAWASLPPRAKTAEIDTEATLLRNLSRRESRCWAACALAELVGVEVGDTAPIWYWSAEVRDTTDADGAPDGDGWPAGWWLSNDIGDMRFFSAEDWCPDGDAHTHVPDLPNGRENAVPALAQALAAVCRDG